MTARGTADRRGLAASGILRNDRGFSLTELAVYIVLLGILASIVAAVITQSFQTERAVAGNTQVGNSGQTFLSTFDRDVRNARSASVGSGGASITLDVADSSATLCWTTITWRFSGNAVTRKAGSGSAAPMIESGVSAGRFAAAARNVDYRFALTAPGAGSSEIAGSSRLGPESTEGRPC